MRIVDSKRGIKRTQVIMNIIRKKKKKKKKKLS